MPSLISGSATEPGGAVELIRSALQEGIRVITITMDDLRVVGSTDDLYAI